MTNPTEVNKDPEEVIQNLKSPSNSLIRKTILRLIYPADIQLLDVNLKIKFLSHLKD